MIAELDGHAYHGHAAAFYRDRARHRRLTARGWRVVAVTWPDLAEGADALEAELRALLGV